MQSRLTLEPLAQVPWRDTGLAASRPREVGSVREPAGLPVHSEPVPCDHCGTPCPESPICSDGKAFCCQGCRAVFELLTENGLGQFYELGERAGIRVVPGVRQDAFRYLDDPAVRRQMLDYEDDRISRVTLAVPGIHCIACVWLLENLFRLRPGIGVSRVNFARRELAVTFEHGRVSLSELVSLLTSMGYAPTLRLASLERRPENRVLGRLWLQVGVAGFAFGNVMLFSLPSYLGLEGAGSAGFRLLFGGLSLALTVPVLVYSAMDYWRAAWLCFRQRWLTIDFPIAIGLAALFGQSAFEIVSGRGEGYLDSLTGLVFFLLCGKVFQHKTYDRLTFDLDYRSFFPLSVVRRGPAGEEAVPISQLAVGDRLVLRHGELVPADSRLVSGECLMDYSFVTGESELARKEAGDHLYAGGQQRGGAIEVETVKPVSQSYLTSLWAHESFAKRRRETLDTLTNRFSRRFTVTVATVAVGAGLFWAGVNPSLALKAFTSVLIVACPCALALAAPFALGTAQRLLSRRQVFLKNPLVIEGLSQIDTVVFDKTGTLTVAETGPATWEGRPLGPEMLAGVAALTRQSAHPHSARIHMAVAGSDAERLSNRVEGFREVLGSGIEGRVGGCRLRLGSAEWLAAAGIEVPGGGAGVHLAVGDDYRGRFRVDHGLRGEVEGLIPRLAERYELALLSGDQDRDRDRFRVLFGPEVQLHFNQSPLNKLDHIQRRREAGRTVMMVGDGLNDAGALRASDVGVAVVENVGSFSPASDVILDARQVPGLADLLRFSRWTVRVVWLSFLLSSLYNAVGISIAASGRLSPVICAILMPLSSFTVVAFACGATRWVARRTLGWGAGGSKLLPEGGA